MGLFGDAEVQFNYASDAMEWRHDGAFFDVFLAENTVAWDETGPSGWLSPCLTFGNESYYYVRI
mgnify:CR=1 FL=1